MSLLAEAATHMTPAGYLITYVLAPIVVLLVPAAIIGAVRMNKATKERAVALAENGVLITKRMDTQDEALARILEVINPVGAPTLAVVLARIQSQQDAQERRLTEHIHAAAADKALFEQRLENLRGTYQ